MFDIIIENGTIIDGSGTSHFHADIGIKDEKIIALENLESAIAKERYNAKGCFVTPGFIDIHTHSDLTVQTDSRQESQIRQGVTTQLMGLCGYGFAPCTNESRKAFEQAKSLPSVPTTWYSFADYLEILDKTQPATNMCALVGHGTIRSLAMPETSTQSADFSDIAKMCAILEKSLEEGAFGISTGLEYFPGKASQYIELEKLCQVIGKYGATHASHVRNRDMYCLSGFLEPIEIARNSNSHLQISHVNPKFGRPDSTMDTLLHIINTARAEGCRIDLDVMPTNWNHTNAKNLLPLWSHTLSLEELLPIFNSKDGRIRLQDNPTPMWQLAVQNKWDRIYVLAANKTKRFIGKSIAEVGELLSQSPFDALCALLVEEAETMGSLRLTSNSFYTEDIIKALSDPYCSVCSDAMSVALDGPYADKVSSPNTYTWAESFLREFVRDGKHISLERAIHKLTALPASQINLKDRGLIKKGYYADIVIFNLENLHDEATISNPNVYPEGIQSVFVNGTCAFHENARNNLHTGKVLRA